MFINRAAALGACFAVALLTGCGGGGGGSGIITQGGGGNTGSGDTGGDTQTGQGEDPRVSIEGYSPPTAYEVNQALTEARATVNLGQFGASGVLSPRGNTRDETLANSGCLCPLLGGFTYDGATYGNYDDSANLHFAWDGSRGDSDDSYSDFAVGYDGQDTQLSIVFKDDDANDPRLIRFERDSSVRGLLQGEMERIAGETALEAVLQSSDNGVYSQTEFGGARYYESALEHSTVPIGLLGFEGEYAHSAIWYENPDLFDTGGGSFTYIGTRTHADYRHVRLGYFGLPTFNTPTLGSALYTGVATGLYFESGSDSTTIANNPDSIRKRSYLLGTARLTVNFGASRVDGVVALQAWRNSYTEPANRGYYPAESAVTILLDRAQLEDADYIFAAGTRVLAAGTGYLDGIGAGATGSFSAGLFGNRAAEAAGSGYLNSLDAGGSRPAGAHLQFSFISRLAPPEGVGLMVQGALNGAPQSQRFAVDGNSLDNGSCVLCIVRQEDSSVAGNFLVTVTQGQDQQVLRSDVIIADDGTRTGITLIFQTWTDFTFGRADIPAGAIIGLDQGAPDPSVSINSVPLSVAIESINLRTALRGKGGAFLYQTPSVNEDDFNWTMLGSRGEYASAGLLLVDRSRFEDSSRNYSTNADVRSTFYGVATPSANVPNPQGSIATFSGASVGAYIEDRGGSSTFANRTYLYGEARLDVDFSNDAIAGWLDMDAWDSSTGTALPNDNILVTLAVNSISHGTFDGIARIARSGTGLLSKARLHIPAGEFNGGFFGPEAQEISGSGYVGKPVQDPTETGDINRDQGRQLLFSFLARADDGRSLPATPLSIIEQTTYAITRPELVLPLVTARDGNSFENDGCIGCPVIDSNPDSTAYTITLQHGTEVVEYHSDNAVIFDSGQGTPDRVTLAYSLSRQRDLDVERVDYFILPERTRLELRFYTPAFDPLPPINPGDPVAYPPERDQSQSLLSEIAALRNLTKLQDTEQTGDGNFWYHSQSDVMGLVRLFGTHGDYASTAMLAESYTGFIDPNRSHTNLFATAEAMYFGLSTPAGYVEPTTGEAIYTGISSGAYVASDLARRSFVLGTAKLTVNFDADTAGGWLDLAAWDAAAEEYRNNGAETVAIILRDTKIDLNTISGIAEVGKQGSGVLGFLSRGGVGTFNGAFFGQQRQEIAGAGYVGQPLLANSVRDTTAGHGRLDFGFLLKQNDAADPYLATDPLFSPLDSAVTLTLQAILDGTDLNPIAQPTVTIGDGNVLGVGCLKCLLSDVFVTVVNEDEGFDYEYSFTHEGETTNIYSDYIVLYNGTASGMTLVYRGGSGQTSTLLRSGTNADPLNEPNILNQLDVLLLETDIGDFGSSFYFQGEVDESTVGYSGFMGEYSQVAFWLEDPQLFAPGGVYADGLDARMVYFGLTTAPETDVIDLNAGFARFSGISYGAYFDYFESSAIRTRLAGTADLYVDFTNNEIDGLVRLGAWDGGNNRYSRHTMGQTSINLNDSVEIVLGNASQTNYYISADTSIVKAGTGSLSLLTDTVPDGKFIGAFFGSNAAEAAGSGYIGAALDEDGNRTADPHLIFGFVARRGTTTDEDVAVGQTKADDFSASQIAGTGMLSASGCLQCPLSDIAVDDSGSYNIDVTPNAKLFADSLVVASGSKVGLTVVYSDGTEIDFHSGATPDASIASLINVVSALPSSLVAHYYESINFDRTRAGYVGVQSAYSEMGLWFDAPGYLLASSADDPYPGPDSFAIRNTFFGNATALVSGNTARPEGENLHTGSQRAYYTGLANGIIVDVSGKASLLVGTARFFADFDTDGETYAEIVLAAADDWTSGGNLLDEPERATAISLTGGSISANLFSGNATSRMVAGQRRGSGNLLSGNFRGGFFGPLSAEIAASGYVGDQNRALGETYVSFGFVSLNGRFPALEGALLDAARPDNELEPYITEIANSGTNDCYLCPLQVQAEQITSTVDVDYVLSSTYDLGPPPQLLSVFADGLVVYDGRFAGMTVLYKDGTNIGQAAFLPIEANDDTARRTSTINSIDNGLQVGINPQTYFYKWNRTGLADVSYFGMTSGLFGNSELGMWVEDQPLFEDLNRTYANNLTARMTYYGRGYEDADGSPVFVPELNVAETYIGQSAGVASVLGSGRRYLYGTARLSASFHTNTFTGTVILNSWSQTTGQFDQFEPITIALSAGVINGNQYEGDARTGNLFQGSNVAIGKFSGSFFGPAVIEATGVGYVGEELVASTGYRQVGDYLSFGFLTRRLTAVNAAIGRIQSAGYVAIPTYADDETETLQQTGCLECPVHDAAGVGDRYRYTLTADGSYTFTDAEGQTVVLDQPSITRNADYMAVYDGESTGITLINRTQNAVGFILPEYTGSDSRADSDVGIASAIDAAIADTALGEIADYTENFVYTEDVIGVDGYDMIGTYGRYAASAQLIQTRTVFDGSNPLISDYHRSWEATMINFGRLTPANTFVNQALSGASYSAEYSGLASGVYLEPESNGTVRSGNRFYLYGQSRLTVSFDGITGVNPATSTITGWINLSLWDHDNQRYYETNGVRDQLLIAFDGSEPGSFATGNALVGQPQIIASTGRFTRFSTLDGAFSLGFFGNDSQEIAGSGYVGTSPSTRQGGSQATYGILARKSDTPNVHPDHPNVALLRVLSTNLRQELVYADATPPVGTITSGACINGCPAQHGRAAVVSNQNYVISASDAQDVFGFGFVFYDGDPQQGHGVTVIFRDENGDPEMFVLDESYSRDHVHRSAVNGFVSGINSNIEGSNLEGNLPSMNASNDHIKLFLSSSSSNDPSYFGVEGEYAEIVSWANVQYGNRSNPEAGNNANALSRFRSTFYGLAAPLDDLFINGTANYTGVSAVQSCHECGPSTVNTFFNIGTGSADLNVDFATSTISGMLQGTINNGAAGEYDIQLLDSSITGNQFGAIARVIHSNIFDTDTFNGTYSGSFFGPLSEEAAGAGYAQDGAEKLNFTFLTRRGLVQTLSEIALAELNDDEANNALRPTQIFAQENDRRSLAASCYKCMAIDADGTLDSYNVILGVGLGQVTLRTDHVMINDGRRIGLTVKIANSDFALLPNELTARTTSDIIHLESLANDTNLAMASYYTDDATGGHSYENSDEALRYTGFAAQYAELALWEGSSPSFDSDNMRFFGAYTNLNSVRNFGSALYTGISQGVAYVGSLHFYLAGTSTLSVNFENATVSGNAVLNYIDPVTGSLYDGNGDSDHDILNIEMHGGSIILNTFEGDARFASGSEFYVASADNLSFIVAALTDNNDGGFLGGFFGATLDEVAGAGKIADALATQPDSTELDVNVNFGFLARDLLQTTTSDEIDTAVSEARDSSFASTATFVTASNTLTRPLQAAGCLKCPLVSETSYTDDYEFSISSVDLNSDYIIVYDGAQGAITIIFDPHSSNDAETTVFSVSTPAALDDEMLEMNNLASSTALGDALDGRIALGAVFYQGVIDSDPYGYLAFESEYAQLGLWHENPSEIFASSQYGYFGDNGGSANRRDAFMAFTGLATRAVDVPTSGSATYSGIATGAYFISTDQQTPRRTQPENRGYLFGTSSIEIDFLSDTVQGSVDLSAWHHSEDNYRTGSYDMQINLNQGQIRENAFEGTTTLQSIGADYCASFTNNCPLQPNTSGTSGTYSGALFGPNAEEAAGVGYAGQNLENDGDRRATYITFGFVGARQ